MARLSLALILLLSACVGAPPTYEEIGESEAPLIGATPVGPTEWTGVLLLRTSFGGSGAGQCTTTLIHPRIAVAALHCVCDQFNRLASASGISLRAGTHSNIATEVARVSELRTPAGAACGGPWDNKDFALMILDRELSSGYEIHDWVETNGEVSVGDLTHHVGYGTQQSGLHPSSVPPSLVGEKRHRTSSISRTFAGEIEIGGSEPVGCYGDSGGPAFTADRRIIGVASRVNGFCFGNTLYVRLAHHAAMVQTAFTDVGGAPPMDAGMPDVGVPDTGVMDSGMPDTGSPDTGVDSGTPDASTPDASIPDSGGFDAGGFDAGGFDAGGFDAGPPPTGIYRSAVGTCAAASTKDHASWIFGLGLLFFIRRRRT